MNHVQNFFVPTRTLQRLMLLLSVAVLGVFIAIGTVYVQRTPALSTRALLATAREPFLALQFSLIPEPRPQGNTDSIPVLTYHRIVSGLSDVENVSYSRFKDHMATLKRAGWNTVTLQEFEEFMQGKRELPERSFLVTFDDGAKDSFYPVDPVLNALNYEATNFIIVASANTRHSTYYLNPLEIKRMLENGRWSIGSHSFDGHRPYPTDAEGNTGIFFADRLWLADQNRLENPTEFTVRVHDDLTRAKGALESMFGVPVHSFAFPLGNETGISGANNFPEGSATTENEARTIYSFGYIQLNNQQFTTNFPRSASSKGRADDFLIYRVHVDHDWDGERVLQILENSITKALPYEDDFSTDQGWITAWGKLELGRNNFTLTAVEGGTSGSVFLDGTAPWDNYSFNASVNWQGGNMSLLADVVDSSTYHSCAFGEGSIRVQSTVAGETRVLAQAQDPRIAPGSNRQTGIRVHGSVIECLWNYESILEAYERPHTGGIGIQIWESELGAARLQVSEVLVRPFGS